ncbi:uncharacterized protein YbjT (DUF2867 family) [Stackebrandtia albiflava]|uniref:Uncharacterized protein YbjT (DUF2867 family) n=1 Tax=Stackebrandtia albiflava TaxID=406432 RepID=A0A562VDZ6_9ACTN|nr:NmrA family NAD(P)-binding protein [Stackebrandtia albiflava]TWJ16085.1 uncharacterized protein YbjT (DUF2867 family) [Stackebrandtia albiflava]
MTILVTGATGNVGHHLVRELHEAGHPVRALTRDAGRAAARLPRGVDVVEGDLADTATLTTAFQGVTAAHLINFGGDDYAILPNGDDIVRLAVASGVRKVTLLSGWDRGSVDEAVESSTLEWTRLMPGEFMSNARDWAETVRATGRISEPFGDAHSPMSHEADIAAVAAVALTGDGHHAQTYQIGAPTSISMREKVRVLAEAVGQDIEFVELTPEQSRRRDVENGVPRHMIDFKIEVFGGLPTEPYPLEGAAVVERLTGRPAYDFARWARENADAFRR